MSPDRQEETAPERPAPARVLVTDDEERMRALMMDMLEEMGHRPLAAADGEACLAMAAEEQPDLILLDLAMPGMDGLEVTRRLRAQEATKHLPIAIVSGKGDLRQRVEALELGANDYLEKPVVGMELQARVQSLLSVKAYHDHLRRHNEELEEQVAARTRKLQETLDRLKASSLETVYRLSRASEFRDQETGEHIQRMSLYSVAIAEELGLPAEEVELLRYATPMHDVGKIGIPDRILLKPGRLDEDEWTVMRRHAEFGARILADSDEKLLQAAAEIALTHHEKWSGEGYPRQLSGEAIPLFGRITALADVFDALLSRRPYKEPFPPERALGIIREERGRHFDPAVVDAFLRAEERLLDIHREHADATAGGAFAAPAADPES